MAIGRRKRIKDKIINFGAKTLAEHERLEALLYNCILYKDTNPLARRIYDFDKNLMTSLLKTKEELISIEGVTPFVAKYLNFLPQLYNYLRIKDKNTFLTNIEIATKVLTKDIVLAEGLYLIPLNAKLERVFILKIAENLKSINLQLALSAKVFEGKNYCLIYKTKEIEEEHFIDIIKVSNYLEESFFSFVDIFIKTNQGIISFKENNLLIPD